MTSADLSLLEQAAKSAGEIALSHWQNAPKFWDKDDNAGPVSEADIAVDEFLKDKLLSARPDFGWLSEETIDTPERLSKPSVFVVDPIDGTRSFIAGEQSWGISVAIVTDRKPVAGVVHMPALNKTFTAEIANGAFLDGNRLTASNPSSPNGARALGAKPNFLPNLWVDGKVPGLERHFRPSLAYRAALVGQGRFDAMLTHRPAWEWDVAAGALIATEAGARVTDWYGEPALFNNPMPKINGMMIAGPDLHQALQSRRLDPEPFA